ncbi:hypothetical protein IGI04_003157 [Brassica rapa subsp. trilocularis]|uniref:F-box associated domain-containing protein n=1 Tax=Brassica rapa subsp. trilocularis TaxID=1813537 RepID=A0ABQ7NXM4_BRACM|nr:hypothetical protein IGI04_003157 [Brassica rapa subsp. trilocularis]
MGATKMVFHIWKTSGLEDFHTTSRKTSRRLPRGLLTESSPMFYRSGFDINVFQIWIRLLKTYGKSSRKTTYTEVVRPTTYMEVVQDKQDDFRVSRLDKNNFFVLFFNCKTNLRQLTRKSSRKSQISDTIRSNAKLTRLICRLDFFLTNKDVRLPCKSSRKTHLKPDDLPGSHLDKQIWKKKTNFIVLGSEIICLAHKSLLQAPIISNKSDPLRIVSFNGSMNHKIFKIKILELRNKECKSIFWCIKNFKLVVHGGWCIDGNGNIVNT